MKKIIFIYSLLFLIIYVNCNCQTDYEEMKMPEDIESLFSNIKFINNQLGYLLFNNKLFRTLDLGYSFQEIKTIPESHTFSDLFVKNDVILLITEWGVGNEYNISTDGGQSWFSDNKITKYSFQIIKSNLIYFIEEKDIPTLFYTENFGVTCEKRFTMKSEKKINENLSQDNKLYFLDDKVGFYYGRYNVEEDKWRFKSTYISEVFIYKTTNGGYNWVNLNSLSTYNDIFGIQFLDNLNGYVYCEKIDISENFTGYLLKTTDGGKNWIEYNINNKKLPYFKFINSENGFLWEDEGPLYKTNNGCKKFEIINIISDHFHDIESLSDGSSFIVTNDKIYKSNIYSDNIINNNVSEIYQDRYKKQEEKDKLFEMIIKADNFYEQKEYNRALTIYLEIIESQDSVDSDILFNTAFCCDKLKKYDDAIYYYTKQLEIEPDSYYALNNIGVIYSNQGKEDLAIEYYKQAILVNPIDDLARNNLKNIQINKYNKIVYENYIEANNLYLELCYDSQYNVFNIDFRKVFKAKKLCEEGLKYESSYEFQLKSILSMMNILIELKEKHPEYYK